MRRADRLFEIIQILRRRKLARAEEITAAAVRDVHRSYRRDIVVRRDILVAIIRTISEEGRTVLFSSHLLDEVERVAATPHAQAQIDGAEQAGLAGVVLSDQDGRLAQLEGQLLDAAEVGDLEAP